MANNSDFAASVMLKALIIDDEPLAHHVILHHLTAHADISIQGQCYNATDALSKLANTPIDLLFLDINMPALSGIELLKVLANRPQVVIISAYQEYALQGFELDVTDYLLKPVSAARLAQALDRVRIRVKATLAPLITATQQAYITLKVDREKRKFILDTISVLEAYGNYVKVWQDSSMSLVSSTLKQLLSGLPEDSFLQVHKSFVINKSRIVAVDGDIVHLACGKKIKVGKSFKKQAQTLL